MLKIKNTDEQIEYWRNRQRQQQGALEKDETKLKKRILRAYSAQAKQLEKEIAYWFETYGRDGVLEYRAMMERLSEDEREALMRMIPTKDEKYMQEWFASLTGETKLKAQRAFEIRDAIYKLNRLEALQKSIELQALATAGQVNGMIEEHLAGVAMRGAKSTADVLGFAFNAVNAQAVSQFVNVPWSDGENFSTTIWKNTQKLARYVNTDLAQGLARGDSYARLTSALIDRTKRKAKNDAYRLVYTEGTYVFNESSIKPFEADFERYTILTAEDGRVCDICKGIQAQSEAEPFNIKDRQPGENFPPFHPWCRCTFLIHVDDWDEWLNNYGKAGAVVADEYAEVFDELKNMGFEFEESEFRGVFEEAILRENVQALKELDEMYYAFMYGSKTLTAEKMRETIVASTIRDAYRFVDVQININPNGLMSKGLNEYIKRERASALEGYIMPCAEKFLSRYTATHEYGHVLHNVLVHFDAEADDQDMLEISERYYQNKIAEYRNEIIHIAKANGAREQEIHKAISEYGKTDPREFFAECFANANCGKPNILGRAMRKFLERRGYGD